MEDEIINYLVSKDNCFIELVKKYGVLGIKPNPSIYESLIYHFISQMISNKVAHSLIERFKKMVNDIKPENVSKLDSDEIKKIGISRRKVEYIENLTQMILDNKINISFSNLNTFDDKEIISYLTTIKGVGEWTAEMVSLFNLGRKNIFSFKDVALKNGIIKTHPNFKTLSKNRFERLRKLYSPYCSIASLYFYKANDDPSFY